MAAKFRFATTTGQTLTLEIERLADGYLYDWSDFTFKATPTTSATSFPEVSGKAGRYALNVTTLEAQFSNGDYVGYVILSSATVGILPFTMKAGSDVTVVPLTAAETWTTILTESYAAVGAAATPAQLLYQLLSRMTTVGSVVGDTFTTLKLDQSTTAATYQVDSSTAPTQCVRIS